jgi:biotin carboxylase
MSKKLLVVGGGPGICDRALVFGAELTLVNLPGPFDPALLPYTRRSIVTDYERDEGLVPMLQALHRAEPFDGVVSMTELALLPAARIAQALGLGGVSVQAVERTRDKVLMRQWLQSKGFPSVPAAPAKSSLDIAAFAEVHGYPVVAKPRCGQGSQRIRRFDDQPQVMAANIVDDDLVVEAFIDGPEFSVESFSFGRQHVVCAVTGKLTNDQNPDDPYVEIGHVVPAPIPDSQRETITEHVQQFLDVMEITDVCTHTELRLTCNGPIVIETHTRVGGDSIPSLVRNATGIDLLDLAVQWPLGLIGGDIPQPRACGAAAIRFFTPRPGTVKALSGVERWRGHPGVLTLHLPLKPGDRIASPKDSFSRAGHVVCVADDPAQAMQACEAVVAGVRIDVAA